MNQIRLTRSAAKANQRGVMLLEGLIAILIFSLGILAMVGMQAVAIGHSSQSKYRTDASFLANKLIARMWVDTNANMSTYATGGVNFVDWKTNELDVYLPPGRNSATVTVTSFLAQSRQVPGSPLVNGYNVNIQIQWRGPNEPTTLPAHTYNVTTQIVRN
jgi:type IV pilus assembly protein PilV